MSGNVHGHRIRSGLFRCGHAKTPENSAWTGRDQVKPRCRACLNARVARWIRENRRNATPANRYAVAAGRPGR